MKDLVRYLTEQLVTKLDEVEITETHDEEDRLVIRVKVAQEDMGRIIGKNGKTAKAIRQLVAAKAFQENIRATVEILE
ncbi:MAG TPA: KH domain-containing protein [bacterium]|nr:KH domain-containing protein [bacterium]HQO36977.1 KH domain-containing protein [bacterium]HQP99386.1 KH domain-containing protein [bacterium]